MLSKNTRQAFLTQPVHLREGQWLSIGTQVNVIAEFTSLMSVDWVTIDKAGRQRVENLLVLKSQLSFDPILRKGM